MLDPIDACDSLQLNLRELPCLRRLFSDGNLCVSHPSTHIDLRRYAISFKGDLCDRILIFNMELSRNNGIRDYLRESI